MQRLTIIMIGLLLAANCMAATHYVVTNGTPGHVGPVDPYTNWATAGTNIIDVVNAAMTNIGSRTVLVSNGTYYLTNQVTITNALTLQSVNGRDVTIVNGNFPNFTKRCFYLNGFGAVLDGFTITNGYNIGDGPGGVWSVAGTTVKNCRITGCITTNPAGYSHGGGAFVSGGVMTNCEVTGNINYNGYGGGIRVASGGTVANCVVSGNTVYKYSGIIIGGGINANGAIISDCKIYGNISVKALYGNGGGVGMENNATLRNSLIYGNQACYGGGVSVYAGQEKIQNCTIVSNVASYGGIYIATGSTKTNYLENVVSYFNVHVSNSNIYFDAAYTGYCRIINSCIAPTSSFRTAGLEGYYYANNIQANPQFVNKDGNDFHLVRGSLCINSGTNERWMDGTRDLDGHSRIDRFSGIADMGCYEYLSRGMIISVP